MPYKKVCKEDLFECQKCGDCCKGYGGTYLTQQDIINISAYINVPPDHFIENFCKLSAGKYVIIQGKNKYCIFWDDICTIHPVKPKMCKAWPFIKSVAIDPVNWELMASVCPGIRTGFPSSVIIKNINQQLFKTRK